MNTPITIYKVVAYRYGIRWTYASKTSMEKALKAKSDLASERPDLDLSIEERVEYVRLAR